MSLTLRTTPKEDAAIERVARDFGLSKQKTLLRLVDQADQRINHVKFSDIKRFKADTPTEVAINDERGRLDPPLR